VAEVKTIVLVLRSGGDFSFRDVDLIARHINGKWVSNPRPRILCLWDKVSSEHNLGHITLLPLPKDQIGTWSRIHLYNPAMEKYRPYLYIDLDTAVISSLENIFALIQDETKFIALEDFWQKGKLATGLVWFPKNSDKVNNVWKSFKQSSGRRMDAFLRTCIVADQYWQQLTNTIHDFKPSRRNLLTELPKGANLVCFHGKPRIFDANIGWVKEYVQCLFTVRLSYSLPVTVIIPYNKDRGWLNEAVRSVPRNVQLLVSQGVGNWPSNFNKVLDQATGKYIRWLHEDDMLTENSIEEAVFAIEEQGVDFIHGNAYELRGDKNKVYIPRIKVPTVQDLINRNVIHSATLMYKREVFEKVGRMDESLWTAEEFEFNLRCLRAGFKIGYCDAFLAYYRRHPMQKVRTVPKSDRTNEREMVKKMYA
jgi:hypothetical protein